MRRWLPALILALSCPAAGAQSFLDRFDYEVNFETLFDNREYKSEFSEDGTIFGNRLRPEVKYNFNPNNHRHLLSTSVDMRHDMGQSGGKIEAEPMLWYTFRKDNLEVSVGTFPRNLYYPEVFFDCMEWFYDPVIEGVSANIHKTGEGGYGNKWHVDFTGDWSGEKTETQREEFALYSHGVWAENVVDKGFVVTYWAKLHHLAASETDHGVVDNILVMPTLAYRDIKIGETKWNIMASWVQSLQRDRELVSGWETPVGLQGEVSVKWHGLELTEILYLGDNQMPFWHRYGYELYKGNSFYRTTHGIYNRLCLSWSPQISNNVGLFVRSIHHYDGTGWDWQQMATLRVSFGS